MSARMNFFREPRLADRVRTAVNTMREGCAGWLRCCGLMTVALSLAACSGGSGGGTEVNTPAPGGDNGGGFQYSGPAPVSPDVQRFKLAFYDNLVTRCSNCHSSTATPAQPPFFVDRADVNVAYAAARTVVNLENPTMSSIVAKVGGGHNCWESPNNAACRVQMISFIEKWANDGGGGATAVKLTAAADRDPNGADADGDGIGDGFRSFPATAGEVGYAASNLYQLLRARCAGCHLESSATAQQPYFASNNIDVAFEAVKSKVDLNDAAFANPALKAKSRLVVRLRDEFHNCWTASCGADAAVMQTAIRALALSITPRVLPMPANRSAGQLLEDGVIGSSGGRFETYQVALWRFSEGEGSLVSDTSGVAPAINLALNGVEGEDYRWIGGSGIQFNGARAHSTSAGAGKLRDILAVAGEYSLEAWVTPANTAQEGPAEIIAYGDGATNRNFMLGQELYNYAAFNRSGATNNRGEPALLTPDDDEVLQASLQHVVMTFDPVAGRRLYVNGAAIAATDPAGGGTLADDWSRDYGFILAGDLGGTRTWRGAIRLVAVHERALGVAEVMQNSLIEPGEKRYVLFNISNLDGAPASCRGGNSSSYCFIYFEVSQYDSYSYLFSRPHFISFNPAGIPEGLVIRGLRLGINGRLAPVGQAFAAVDAVIAGASYTAGDEPGSGQLLSQAGTIIARENGGEADLFYLEFDRIGTSADRTPPPVVLPFAFALDAAPAIDMGWRTFDEISASFAALTGVPVSAAIPGTSPSITVNDVFDTVRQQLPAVADFNGLLASHHTAIAQLAVAYCSAAVNDAGYRAALLPTLNINTNAAAVTWQSAVIDPLLNAAVAVNLWGSANAGYRGQLSTELSALISHDGSGGRTAGLAWCGGGSCPAGRTAAVATATCAAVLGSAAATLQ